MLKKSNELLQLKGVLSKNQVVVDHSPKLLANQIVVKNIKITKEFEELLSLVKYLSFWRSF